LKESGIDVVMSQWYGLAAPAGTPKETVDALTRYVKQALQQPELLKVYRNDGAQEATLSGAEFRDFIVKDIANYKRAVDRGNLKLE
jgi:tripartite-type tricarboxylate transporter receptor subunit TctC